MGRECHGLEPVHLECHGVCAICPEKYECPESPQCDPSMVHEDQEEEYYFGEGSQ